MSAKAARRHPGRAGSISPTKNELEAMRINRRAELQGRIAKSAGWIGVVLASALPIWAGFEGAEAFAGEDTTLEVSIAIGIGVSLAGVSVALAGYTRYLRRELDRRDREIRRLKDRLDVSSGHD